MAKLPCFYRLLMFVICLNSGYGDNCLSRSSTMPWSCICCKSGYTGDDCMELCTNCESRLLVNGDCIQKCTEGYHGRSCNVSCSSNCIEGNRGSKICRKDDGFCVNGCITGHFGLRCDHICSDNCYNKECVQDDGKCNKCNTNRYHGSDCSIPCSPGCYNGTCTRNGICIGGCNVTYYGESCAMPCGQNCKNWRCTSDTTGFACTDGCKTGYTSKKCTDKCPIDCKECEQYGSQCISCMDNTERHCEDEHCLKGHVSCRPKPLQDHGFKKELLLLILIPVVVILLVLLIVVLKRKGKLDRYSTRRAEDGISDDGARLLSGKPYDKQPHFYNDRKTEGNRIIPGTLGEENTQKRIEQARQVFLSTNNYKEVKRLLEGFGHVTICGASGEGKTTMSLILAGEYSQLGYDVVFVENIDIFDLNECIKTSQKLFLIFDDVFGSVGLSTNATQLRNKLHSLIIYLRQCKEEKRKRATGYFSEQTKIAESDLRLLSKRSEQTKIAEADVCMVFTSKTYNFRNFTTLLQDEVFSLFPSYSVVDLTTNKDYKYSKEEKVAIFNQYKQDLDDKSQPQISVEDINSISDILFGFPMTCRLFFDNPSFRAKGKEFFQNPLLFLKLELKTLLSKDNDRTAALALMLLCENNLNLSDLELPGRDPLMDERFNILTSIFPNSNRIGICKAVRAFVGTFFSGKDVIQFSHSSIYDACACAMYNVNQSFLLKYCSYDFLFERVKPETDGDSDSVDRTNYISVSCGYYNLVAERIYEAMKEGNFTKSVTHPMLEKEQVVQLIFQKLQSESNQTDPEVGHWIHGKDKGKGFLYWVVHGHSSQLADKIENVANVKFAQSEIREALDATVEKDTETLLKLFLSQIDKYSHPATISKLLLLSAEHGSLETAKYLLNAGADMKTSNENNRNCLHLACYAGNINVLKIFMSQVGSLQKVTNSVDVEGRTPAMLAALVGSEECFLLVVGKTDIDIKDIYGDSVIHAACFGGNQAIVQRIMLDMSFNVDIRGQHGLSPIMKAVLHRHLSVFQSLLSKRADCTLLSDNGDTLLHLACQGGEIAIVQRLVSPININRRGMHGWTPVMKAAVNGHLRVFEYLKSSNADLELLSSSGDSVLHLACQGGNESIVRQLLLPSNINSRGKHKCTPIMKAVKSRHLSVFEFLMSDKADHTLVDGSGDSLLHLACEGGNKAIVRKLVSPSNINSRGIHNCTPVMKAVARGHQGVFNLLASIDADLHMEDNYGNNLLHMACQGGNTVIVQELVSEFNINGRGRYATTPAMKAAYCGHREILELLIENRADLKLVDEDSDDVVSYAKLGGQAETADFLESILGN